jgi:hypothetical protein
MAESVLVIAVLLIAALLRVTIGFGQALIAMPLLALLVDIRTAIALVGLTGATISLLMLWYTWQAVDLRITWRLVLASLVGMPFGLLLVTQAPEAVIKIGLGLVLVGFSLYNLLQFRLPELPPVWRGIAALLAGFLGGLLGAAYNTNGPPVIIYGMLDRWSPEKFRATLQGFFSFSGLAVLLGQGAAGLWTETVLWLFAWSLPGLLLALLLGEKLAHLLDPARFTRLVHMMLVLMGILLIVNP